MFIKGGNWKGLWANFYVSYNDRPMGGRFFETAIDALGFYAEKLTKLNQQSGSLPNKGKTIGNMKKTKLIRINSIII
jgi:hypothetical protein